MLTFFEYSMFMISFAIGRLKPLIKTSFMVILSFIQRNLYMIRHPCSISNPLNPVLKQINSKKVFFYLCGTFYLSKLSKPVLKQINSCPTVAVTVDQQGTEKQIVVESAD